jgi:hypothetical protein
MPITYPELKVEITNDPKTLGYAGKSDEQIAQLLNTVGLSVETLFKGRVAVEDFIAEIVGTEYDALSAAGKTQLDQFVRGNWIKSGSANMRTTIGALFAAGTTTRTNLLALCQRSATRGEVLFGEGITVSHQDVAAARALP